MESKFSCQKSVLYVLLLNYFTLRHNLEVNWEDLEGRDSNIVPLLSLAPKRVLSETIAPTDHQTNK